MERKYEFTGETKVYQGRTLRRIRALRSFGGVVKGELGGWIEKDSNLSHEGDCWVSDNAHVFRNAQVYGYAWVLDDAEVSGNAQVYGDAWVGGNVKVYDNASVFDNTYVSGKAHIHGDARVMATMQICFDIDTSPESLNTTDGYTMTLDKKNGKISCGCRYMTFQEAIDHWKITRGGTALGQERIDYVRFLAYRAGVEVKV